MPSFKPKTNKEITTDIQRNITLDIKHNEFMKKFHQAYFPKKVFMLGESPEAKNIFFCHFFFKIYLLQHF